MVNPDSYREKNSRFCDLQLFRDGADFLVHKTAITLYKKK